MDIETTSLITTSTTPKKVHKKKAAKLQILKTLTESNVNMYGIPKKLIIFDLNHVLIFRPKKFSEKFILRPHAKQFLHEIAQRFAVGVWSSMSKKVGRPIVESVFQDIQLEFRLFQNHCETIEVDTVISEPEDISLSASEIKNIPKKLKKKHGRIGDDKPHFLKNLCRAFGIYPQWNFTNTVLIDDSPEKCFNNPPYS
eukprot:gene39102-52838_t